MKKIIVATACLLPIAAFAFDGVKVSQIAPGAPPAMARCAVEDQRVDIGSKGWMYTLYCSGKPNEVFLSQEKGGESAKRFARMMAMFSKTPSRTEPFVAKTKLGKMTGYKWRNKDSGVFAGLAVESPGPLGTTNLVACYNDTAYAQWEPYCEAAIAMWMGSTIFSQGHSAFPVSQ